MRWLLLSAAVRLWETGATRKLWLYILLVMKGMWNITYAAKLSPTSWFTLKLVNSMCIVFSLTLLSWFNHRHTWAVTISVPRGVVSTYRYFKGFFLESKVSSLSLEVFFCLFVCFVKYMYAFIVVVVVMLFKNFVGGKSSWRALHFYVNSIIFNSVWLHDIISTLADHQ